MVRDIRRFKNVGSLIAYAGLDAPPCKSGKFEATNDIYLNEEINI